MMKKLTNNKEQLLFNLISYHFKVNKTNKWRKKMEPHKISGILSIILGLIFIIFPIFSSGLVSIMVGLSLVFLGLTIILSEFSAINIIIGILAIIFGLLFIFNIDALSFLLGLQFYIIGILMIVLGITGLISGENVSKIASIMIILLGFISFIVAGFSLAQPLYAAILIGVCLIIQGIRLYLI